MVKKRESEPPPPPPELSFGAIVVVGCVMGRVEGGGLGVGLNLSVTVSCLVFVDFVLVLFLR